jgi:hypothetical protein
MPNSEKMKPAPGSAKRVPSYGDPSLDNSARIVLNIYGAIRRSALSDHQALAAAVRAWRERHPDVSKDEATLAVTRIISGRR